MRQALFVIAVCVALCGASLNAAPNVEIMADAQPREVIAGGRLTYTVQVVRYDGADDAFPRMPDFTPFQVRGSRPGGSQIFTQISNGVASMKETVTYEYELAAPTTPGVYKIPATEAEWKGTTLKSPELSINVIKDPVAEKGGLPAEMARAYTKPSRAAWDAKLRGKIFIVPKLSKESVVVRDQVTVTWTLYIERALIESLASRGLNLGRQWRNIEPTDAASMDDFFVHVMFDVLKTRMIEETIVVDGVEYSTMALRTLALFPNKSGTLKISRLNIVGELPDASNNAPLNPLFAGSLAMVIPADEIPIEVTQPPTEGRPADWKGIVGTAKIVARADKLNVTQRDDIISVEVVLTGEGYLPAFSAPVLSDNDVVSQFDVVEGPAAQMSMSKDGRLAGVRSWKFLLRAEKTGDVSIPPFKVVAFNPQTNRYETSQSDPIPLRVKPLNPNATPGPAAAPPQSTPAVDAPVDPKLDDFAIVDSRDWDELRRFSILSYATHDSAWWAVFSLAALGLGASALRTGSLRRRTAPTPAMRLARVHDALERSRPPESDVETTKWLGDISEHARLALIAIFGDAAAARTSVEIESDLSTWFATRGRPADELPARYRTILERLDEARYTPAAELDRAGLIADTRAVVGKLREAMNS